MHLHENYLNFVQSNILFTVNHNNNGPNFNQALEWNDEPTEEPGGAESPPIITDEIFAQSSERKEDNVVAGTEENEWDRLLRVR